MNRRRKKSSNNKTEIKNYNIIRCKSKMIPVFESDNCEDFIKKDFVTADDEYEYHFSNMKFYSVTRSSFTFRDHLLFKNIDGAVTLDYCCGNGQGKKGNFVDYRVLINSSLTHIIKQKEHYRQGNGG